MDLFYGQNRICIIWIKIWDDDGYHKQTKVTSMTFYKKFYVYENRPFYPIFRPKIPQSDIYKLKYAGLIFQKFSMVMGHHKQTKVKYTGF